jgi:putative PEP-CTERM system histidine kinase
MFELVLSCMAVALLLAVGVSVAAKQRTASNLALLVTMCLLAGIEALDQLSLRLSSDTDLFKHAALFLEGLLPISFLLLSYLYYRSRPAGGYRWLHGALIAASLMLPSLLLVLGAHDFYYSPDFPNEAVLFLGNAGYWYYIAIMGLLIISLVNVEATLRAIHGTDRYRMKFEAIGIISLLAVLIFYYSQGLLYRTINMNLIPIRSSIFIIGSVLIGYSRLMRGSGARVTVSRFVLYRSVALLAVGLYLLGLGLVGEGMRYFGVSFGRDLTIFLAFAGGILTLAILISEKVRRTAKVYISKHFYAHKHDYRQEWIKSTGRLAACSTLFCSQDAILAGYRETFGLKGASLYLLGRDEKHYLRRAGHDMPEKPLELPISPALRDYFTNRERVLNLDDGEYNLSVHERQQFREAGASLVVPLICNGRIEGIMVFGEQLVPEKLTYEDYDLMKVMARQAAQAITNLRLSEELMETRSMAAVAKISSFVIHDLKNLTTSLSLVVDNAQEHIENPEFQKDAITTIKGTLVKMRVLMQRLKFIPEKFALDQRLEDIDRLSRETVAELSKAWPSQSIVYDGSTVYSCVDREEIKKVIVNVVQNAREASSELGEVLVETYKDNGRVCIRITDHGGGMDEDFRNNQLFKPFRTTKEKGLGIGLYQCRQIVEAHNGRIDVISQIGKGSVFTIVLPGAEQETKSSS